MEHGLRPALHTSAELVCYLSYLVILRVTLRMELQTYFRYIHKTPKAKERLLVPDHTVKSQAEDVTQLGACF